MFRKCYKYIMFSVYHCIKGPACLIVHVHIIYSIPSFPASNTYSTMHQSLFLVHPTLSMPPTMRPLRHRRHHVAATSITVAAPRREADPKRRIVITGMGIVSVFGNDVDKYYDSLLEGENGIDTIDRFDVSTFPTKFGGQIRNFSSEGYIDGKSDRRLDNCWRYGIVSGKKALENAGLGLETEAFKKLDKERAGVLLGSGIGGMGTYSDGIAALISKGVRKMSPFFIPYIITNMGSALLGIDIGFMGPNYSISTACATANYCFHAAANHIRRGESDIILVGGTEAALVASSLGGFSACR